MFNNTDYDSEDFITEKQEQKVCNLTQQRALEKKEHPSHYNVRHWKQKKIT